MTNELSIDLNSIRVSKGLIEFNEYQSLLAQAQTLAEAINTVQVSDDNIKVSKQMLAAVNKSVKQLEDRRVQVKKELLQPYEEFESQIKNIISIVRDADKTVKSQVRELEERERDEKEESLSVMFGKRIKHYSFGSVFSFKDFLKPQHLNKSTSIKSVETEMVTWLEKIDADLKVIDSLDNTNDVLEEYSKNIDLSKAISVVSERHKRQEELKQVIQSKNSKRNKFSIEVYDEKDMKLIEIFMDMNGIKNTIKKVEL